ncbi:hypothetical protein CBL_05421 [Carabus blaptoides fortunei]
MAPRVFTSQPLVVFAKGAPAEIYLQSGEKRVRNLCNSVGNPIGKFRGVSRPQNSCWQEPENRRPISPSSITANQSPTCPVLWRRCTPVIHIATPWLGPMTLSQNERQSAHAITTGNITAPSCPRQFHPPLWFLSSNSTSIYLKTSEAHAPASAEANRSPPSGCCISHSYTLPRKFSFSLRHVLWPFTIQEIRIAPLSSTAKSSKRRQGDGRLVSVTPVSVANKANPSDVFHATDCEQSEFRRVSGVAPQSSCAAIRSEMHYRRRRKETSANRLCVWSQTGTMLSGCCCQRHHAITDMQPHCSSDGDLLLQRAKEKPNQPVCMFVCESK